MKKYFRFHQLIKIKKKLFSNFFLNLLKLLINLLFVVQIILIILIFLTATYWFFNLIGSQLFNFAEPIASTISDFVKIFYDRDIIVTGIYVDGSLLLFDMTALIAIFVIAKSKYYLFKMQNFFVKNIYKCKKNIEDNFNTQLQKNAEDMIRKYNHAALLITFEAKDLKVDRFWGGDPEAGVRDTETYLVESFCSMLDKMKGFSYKKGGKKVIIYIKEFDSIDKVLNFVSKFISDNRAEMRANKWTMDYYCAVTVYGDGTSVDLDVLPKLEALLNIKQKNEIVCFGNFNLRYSLKLKPLYYGVRLKGSYAIDGGSDIYCLVKNNEAENKKY